MPADPAKSADLPLLFSPISLRSVTARNRIVASPMCQYRSEDGGPNDWQLVHLGRLAIGGRHRRFGEQTAVAPAAGLQCSIFAAHPAGSGCSHDGRRVDHARRAGRAHTADRPGRPCRPVMWYADWPAHMARELGVRDHRFMPEGYAHRFQLRDHQATMDINQRTPENYATVSELAGITVTPD